MPSDPPVFPRIAFVGAVEGSRVAFDTLRAAGLTPHLLLTLPTEASHRHSDFVDLTTPARAAGVEVHHTTDINAAATISAMSDARPDLTLVIGWSQIAREAFRSVARIGTLGFHPAPLPRFRGRAVIPWTILTGQTTTGSTLFWLDEGVDSGPIVLQRTFEVASDETARSLYDKHLVMLAGMLPSAVALALTGNAPATPQDHARASYCAKRTPEDGIIDWREPARRILRFVRAVGEPYPGAHTFVRETRLIVDAARPHGTKGRYVGFAGQVQSHTAAGFTVLCGDGETIEVTAWRNEAGGCERPRVHARLSAQAANDASIGRSSMYQCTKRLTPSSTLVVGQ